MALTSRGAPVLKRVHRWWRHTGEVEDLEQELERLGRQLQASRLQVQLARMACADEMSLALQEAPVEAAERHLRLVR